ncbi:hypothetical protein GCM10027051_27950 [Niabella terrae]
MTSPLQTIPAAIVLSLGILLACNKGKSASGQNPVTDTTDTTKPPVDNNDGDPPPGGVSGTPFLYGSNMGYYPGWTDEQLAEILLGSQNAEGAGVNSLRPALYDDFVAVWGYDFRVKTFQLYSQLGAKDNVIFLNQPREAYRDKTIYCDGHQSMTFANLYEPIWKDDGQINEENYYARYVYELVKRYDPYVKYWEVWNEPDFATNWDATQTWKSRDPDPCDLTGFYAPVQKYVRMLRITSEVVRKLAPDDLVCLGGIGYDGFLHAILRNTDNPSGGTVTDAYPQKGGAWFDCVSFHVYPMYYLGNSKNSDRAAQAITDHRNDMEAALAAYQLGGTKKYLITEFNIPRRVVSGYIGSDEAQRNFMIKAALAAQKSGIDGIYVFAPAEASTPGVATNPFDLMGLYEALPATPYQAKITPSGIAWRTISRLLSDRLYDPARTQAMKLPFNVDGGAFYSATTKDHIYVLWAKASGNNETATASYSFPASFNISSATQYSWDQQSSQVSGTLTLSAAPVFVQP